MTSQILPGMQHGNNVMGAQPLEASLPGEGTVLLRPERDAWSMVKRLRQATKRTRAPPFPPPLPAPLLLSIPELHEVRRGGGLPSRNRRHERLP